MTKKGNVHLHILIVWPEKCGRVFQLKQQHTPKEFEHLLPLGQKKESFFSKRLTFNHHNMWFCHHLYEDLQEVPLKHFGTPVTLKLCYKNAFDSIF